MDYRGFAPNEQPRRTPGQRRFWRLVRRGLRVRSEILKRPKPVLVNGQWHTSRWAMTLDEAVAWNRWYAEHGKRGPYAPVRRVRYGG